MNRRDFLKNLTGFLVSLAMFVGLGFAALSRRGAITNVNA